MDIYALGTILVEIADWRQLRLLFFSGKDIIFREPVTTWELASVVDHLSQQKIAFRMGSMYHEVTIACLFDEFLEGVHDMDEQGLYDETKMVIQQNFYEKVIRRLEGCVI